MKPWTRSRKYRGAERLLVLLVAFSLGFCGSYVSAGSCYYPDNKNNIFVHAPNTEKMIALTFDDGPHPGKTPRILDVLSKYQVKATFFMIGQNAEQNPALVRRVKEEGHEIGNHTYDHKRVSKLTDDTLRASVEKCSQVIESIIGERPALFRPPEGYCNDTLASDMCEDGYDVILWRVDTLDWQGRTADTITATVCRSVRSGDIILMHDAISRQSHTHEALDKLIPFLQSEGYRFVTVSELIAH